LGVIEHGAWLLLWGTLVGLDLVSVGQIMIARPLVAGTVAGLIMGDPVSAGTVAVIFELFALDMLPVGAAQYPDYGIGSVAAAATAARAPGVLGIGLAVCVGLGVAYLGDLGIRLLRRRNTADARRCQAALAAGDSHAIVGLHLRSLFRDGVRCVGLTAVGLAAAAGVHRWHLVTVSGAVLVMVVAIGAALGAGATGIMRLSGRRGDLWWLLSGLLVGAVVVAAL
jgi:mannose/fructose/N-acetylgalactosamine-specific phosphotransferase system component IIC